MLTAAIIMIQPICLICDAHRIRCEITDVSRPTALHRRHPVNKDRS